ncbi:MAG: hypothetical protein ACREQY_05915, partial [Candidatus Binatia bacterium]
MTTRAIRPGVLALMLLTSGCLQPPLRVAAWIVEWRDAHLTSAIESLDLSDRVLTEIDFFRFHFDPEGNLSAARPLTPAHRSLARVAAERGILRLATVVNDTVGRDRRAIRLKDPAVVHRILRDPARRQSLVADLRSLVGRGGYDGIDVDFEKLYARDRDAFSAFIAELAPAVHARGGRLVVTVHPRLRDEE